MSQTYIQQRTISLARAHNITNNHSKSNTSQLENQEHHWMFSGSAPDSDGEGDRWKALHARTPPVENGHSLYPTRERDDTHLRPELGSRLKSAEQLPPLSSIFQDAGSRISLPSLSRGSNAVPTFNPASPHNGQSAPGSCLQQQYWDDPSYLRPVSEPSIQFTHGRPAYSLRNPELPPPPPRSQHDLSKPSSPGYFDPTKSQFPDGQREAAQTSAAVWSPPAEQTYREHYQSAATSAYDHPSGPRESGQAGSYAIKSALPARESDVASQHAQIAMPQSPGRSEQQNANSKNCKSSSAPKGTLGPKIWTGTHFLPRFVREAEVPGEGLCYFYDDGTYCKTVIDDEPVNAHWGVTKAGKPRKRLAIACITCREKKIKCDPDYPRCVQCEKFGRVCRFKNAPRGGHGSPDASSADADELNHRSVSDFNEHEPMKQESREAQYANAATESNSPRREIELTDVKRRRSNYMGYTRAGAEQREAYVGDKTPSRSQYSPVLHPQSLNWCAMQAGTNPFESDRAFSLGLLEVFFAHISGSTYCFLPEHHFRRWACDESTRKSKDDLVVIYAVLAMATTYSVRDDMKARGAEYAAIARYAATGREFSLQLVQARLLLSVYYYAINIFHEAWDYCGGALRTALGMNLNLEIDVAELEPSAIVYGLNKSGYAECRRRTFWSCYLVDHFTGFCNNALSTISQEDIFLRVPVKTKHFESQSDTVAPFFDSTRLPIPDVLENAGVMAYLANVCSIWGDVRANIYRCSQASASFTSEPFSTFYTNINMRLDAWYASLPENLKFNAQNLDSKLNLGISGSFMTMHCMYHITHAKLNRYLKHDSVSPYQLENSIRLTYQHCDAILELADIVASRTQRMPNSPAAARPFSSLYAGFAMMVAVDVMTAKGRLTDIPKLRHRLESVTRIISELEHFWYCARKQRFALDQRLRALHEVERGGGEGWTATNGNLRPVALIAEHVVDNDLGIFEFKEAIDQTAKGSDDCVYKVGWDMYDKALRREAGWNSI